ncbi:DUF3150 domain-containing protein [Trichloromonas sp.]|uniref:DUF3150 domain-containing protein n=1 Tax=Trichloromonas sp. TaxID=3069249 RepID=UPI001D83C18A|nr:DUF3150 domain-containing protein [Desulfuromonadaceae bacterium]MDY0269080.1 DUF3150 domain-containing protein [Trichloromonas sp.]
MKLTVLEEIVLFILDIRLWTGRKKLKEEDLALNGIDTHQLPPGTLASLGSKKIISSEALAPFQAMKREAEKILLATGVRFLGGYAVPTDKAAEVEQRLIALQTDFQAAKSQLLQQYDAQVNSWIDANPPQWAPIIRAAIDSVTTVDKALQFGFTPVAIQPSQALPESDPLQEQTQGLYGQLCHEIRLMARTAFAASYAGKGSITRKALRPLVAMREKLSALAFLDQQIPPLINSIDESLSHLPSSGPIAGNDLNLLAGLLSRQLMRMGLPVDQQIEEEDPLGFGDSGDIMNTCTVTLAASGTQNPRQPATALQWDF